MNSNLVEKRKFGKSNPLKVWSNHKKHTHSEPL